LNKQFVWSTRYHYNKPYYLLMQKSCDYISTLLILCVIVLIIPQFSLAQANNQDSQKVKVMVLGTFHFHHAPDYFDILSPANQQQLDSVINSIAEFEPTKITLEASYKDSAKFDSLYQQFRAGKHQLTSNERQQLGFRLADQFDHETVYPVDYILRWPYQEVMSWAEKNQPSFLEFYDQWQKKGAVYEEELYKNATLTEHLQWLNSKSYRDRLKKLRMKRLELGAGSNFVGAKPISSSYERNLKIFANIIKYAEPGDRIIAIFGASHGYFLREFVQMHPDTKLVETLDYL